MLKYIGSKWGGWMVETDLIQSGDTILSAGIANDTTFEEELLQRYKLNFICIDPTPLAKTHMDNKFRNKIFNNNVRFLPRALSDTSEPICVEGQLYDSIGLNDILEQEDISLLKLDIETSEYYVFNMVKNLKVKQVAIEMHHWIENSGYTLSDSLDLIDTVRDYGYKFVYHNVNVPERIIQECLFIRADLTTCEEIHFENLLNSKYDVR